MDEWMGLLLVVKHLGKMYGVKAAQVRFLFHPQNRPPKRSFESALVYGNVYCWPVKQFRKLSL